MSDTRRDNRPAATASGFRWVSQRFRTSIRTTTNIYGKAMTDSKRQAHSKAVEMVLNGSKPEEKPVISAIGS